MEWHDSCVVEFLIEFWAFCYIICYFWWFVQRVLVLKEKWVFFWQSLIRRAVFGRHSESGLWCFVFSVSYGPWNGMILVWLHFLLIFGRFGVLYAIFVTCAGSFGSKCNRVFFC